MPGPLTINGRYCKQKFACCTQTLYVLARHWYLQIVIRTRLVLMTMSRLRIVGWVEEEAA